MSKTDYLPSNVFEFQNKVHNIRRQVTINQGRWDISPNAAAGLDGPIADFDAAVAVSENPETRTAAAIKRRDDARAVLEKVLRPFVQGKLEHNPLVTDDDLTAMGLPVYDHTRSPLPDPDEEPELTVSTPSPAVVEIAVRKKNETGRAKPKGIHGAELRWVIAAVAPVDWTELTHSEFTTRSPFRLSFSGNERGKWLYFAARWENNRGRKGPWCEIMSAVIP
jgi:hypothetical protein